METPDAKASLRQNVLDALSEFQAGRIDLEVTMTYLMEIIEAGDPARYQHSIALRAHD